MEELYNTIAAGLITIVGALVSWGVAELTRYIRAHTKNEHARAAMHEVGELAESVVRNLEQEFKRAGADGKLTPEEIQAIKRTACERTMKAIPGVTQKALNMGVGALVEYIGGQVESKVFKVKAEQKFLKRQPSGK